MGIQLAQFVVEGLNVPGRPMAFASLSFERRLIAPRGGRS
jgi:hypothetical protein